MWSYQDVRISKGGILLKMGRIKPSPEAIDMHMNVGEKSIEMAKNRLLSVVGQDIYYGTLNPAQAALMLYGIAPPTPKETISLMEEIFVKKEKLLEKKYVDILTKVRTYYKAQALADEIINKAAVDLAAFNTEMRTELEHCKVFLLGG